MGIALPPWIVEGKNNIWVLGIYGLLFGVSLPALVGRWWFGSRRKSKDGVYLQSAAIFFKTLREDSGVDEVMGCVGKAYQHEHPIGKKSPSVGTALNALEKEIAEKAGRKWESVRDLVGINDTNKNRALILLYAHLLRIPISDSNLQKGNFNLDLCSTR
jgi:translocation protein SEC63